MNRFQDELRKISGVAWVIAVLLFGVMFCLLIGVAAPHDEKISRWPFVAQVLFSACMGLILFVWALLIGYIAGDARLRGMRVGLWVAIAILVPNTIGIILYFVLRDPILQPCRNCGYSARGNFTFCPQCGTELQPACPNCRKAVEAGWRNCANCGVALQPVKQER
jgi:hypothetical protein